MGANVGPVSIVVISLLGVEGEQQEEQVTMSAPQLRDEIDSVKDSLAT